MGSKLPSQTIKGGLVDRPPNSLSGLLHDRRLLRIPQETKETSGTLGNEANVSDRQLNEETVPPYRKHEVFEQTSVFVCFALRTQAKPGGTEDIVIVNCL